MFKLLCVTNRKLCEDDFLERLECIAHAGADALILREKDLTEREYEALAEKVLPLDRFVPVILHNFWESAIRLGAARIHLSFPDFCRMSEGEREQFSVVGVSCHSFEEAVFAEAHGATYVTAGHIFETDCKRGIPARGLAFLQDVCGKTHLPVYAIGGVSAENMKLIERSGASGACVMSGAMRCLDPQKYFQSLREQL